MSRSEGIDDLVELFSGLHAKEHQTQNGGTGDDAVGEPEGPAGDQCSLAADAAEGQSN